MSTHHKKMFTNTAEMAMKKGVRGFYEEDFCLDQTRKISINKDSLKRKKIFIEAEDKDTAIAISAYRHLRTNMFKALEECNGRTLMVAGPTSSVGKTTTAVNLAISIARLGQRTALLVDLDLRRPSIHKIFEYEPEYGVVDVVENRTVIEDALITPDIDRLSVLTGKDAYENSSEILSANLMRNFISDLHDRYPERVIILDSPPILGCDDVEVMSYFVDACLVVIDQNTTKQELEDSMQRIKDIRVAGYVMNKSSEAKYDRYYY